MLESIALVKLNGGEVCGENVKEYSLRKGGMPVDLLQTIQIHTCEKAKTVDHQRQSNGLVVTDRIKQIVEQFGCESHPPIIGRNSQRENVDDTGTRVTHDVTVLQQRT